MSDLRLDHARVVLDRLCHFVEREEAYHGETEASLRQLTRALGALLAVMTDDPPPDAAFAVGEAAAVLARRIAGVMVEAGISDPDVGRQTQDLFVCLALAREGEDLGLELGARP